MPKTRSPRSAEFPHVEAGNSYARDVVEGKILACKWVRLACKRHLDDLEWSKGHNYPYRFDPKTAEKWCKFIELLPHTKGEWARRGEKLRLDAHSCRPDRVRRAASVGGGYGGETLMSFLASMFGPPTYSDAGSFSSPGGWLIYARATPSTAMNWRSRR